MSSQDALWAQIFVWTANSISLIYNIPQMVHTYQTKKTADISAMFLILRFVSSFMWCFYCVWFQMYDVGATWLFTLVSNMMIMYFKFLYKPQEQQQQSDDNDHDNKKQHVHFNDTNDIIIIIKEDE